MSLVLTDALAAHIASVASVMTDGQLDQAIAQARYNAANAVRGSYHEEGEQQRVAIFTEEREERERRRRAA